MAPLLAAYAWVAKWAGAGCVASTLDIIRITPRSPPASGSWASIRRMAARVTRNWLVAFDASTVSQPSSVASWTGPSPNRRPLIPATL